MAIILKNAPKTEEGCKLNLSKEDEENINLCFVSTKNPRNWICMVFGIPRKYTEMNML